MARFVKSSRLATFLSFILVLMGVEAAVQQVRADLPVDPDKWPRTEIAQKLNQLDRAIKKGRRFDVVFAGSSVMAGGVDPIAFSKASGVSSYNAAWAGATSRTSAMWIHDVVDTLVHPEVVVLGLQTGELNDNGPKNQRGFRKFKSAPGYRQAIRKMFMDNVFRWLEEISTSFKYRLAFREPRNFARDKAALKRTRVRKRIGARGRRVEDPTGYHFRDKFKNNFYENNLVRLAFGGREYRAARRLHGQLAESGAQLILMATPVTKDYWRMHDHPKRDKRALRALFRRFQNQTGGTVIDVIDAFPTSVPFRDPVHLDIDARKELARTLADGWQRIAASRGGWFEVKCRGNLRPQCRLISR